MPSDFHRSLPLFALLQSLGKQRLSLSSWIGRYRDPRFGGSGVGRPCSVSAWKSPSGGKLLMLQNLFSSGTQPAGSLLHRVLAPSPQPATLEVSEILKPQIKAMGSILLGRREKIAFCIVIGERNSLLGASGRRAAGSWSWSFFIAMLLTALIPGLLYSQKGGFLYHINQKPSWTKQSLFQRNARKPGRTQP